MTTRPWHLTRGQHLDGATSTLTIARPVTTPASRPSRSRQAGSAHGASG